jgi:hypothetical protein
VDEVDLVAQELLQTILHDRMGMSAANLHDIETAGHLARNLASQSADVARVAV